MSRIFAAVIVAMLLLGGTLAADAAQRATPDSQTQNQTVTLIADGFDGVSVIPIVLLAASAFGAIGLMRRAA